MWLIGRQPILDRDERITAYELFFRSPGEDHANIIDARAATATVILGALAGFGVDQVLGDHQGYVNVDEDLLFDDALELLPQESIVLELLESIQPTEAVVSRCQQLRARNWRFALDDHKYSPEYEPLYPLIDIVKIDLSSWPQEGIDQSIEQLRRYPLRFLAEKVETREQFQHCYDLGFHLFQGYYFARPSTLTHRRIDEGGATLLKLLRLLMDDAETREIEAVFRGSPGLTFNLLMLVNSVGFGLRQRIGTVRQAISMLGRQQMRRWIQLALFGAGDESALDVPLLDIAAVRATFMEQLARRHPVLSKDRDAPDEAFMIGILSVLDTIYDVEMEDLVKSLRLSDSAAAALLRREGLYGQLLQCVEQMERLEIGEALGHAQLLQLTRSQVLEAQLKAFTWRSPVAA